MDCKTPSGKQGDYITLQITLRENVMKSFISRTVAAAVAAFALSGAAQAADSVNVAFFLEWATPNQIAKVDKAYDEAMGVDVNWTDFSTGVAMTPGSSTATNTTVAEEEQNEKQSELKEIQE